MRLVAGSVGVDDDDDDIDDDDDDNDDDDRVGSERVRACWRADKG